MKINKPIIFGFQILRAIYNVKVSKKRIPLYCEWEVTKHCNMRCSFCSTRASQSSSREDASTVEALDIVQQLSDMGTKIIHFSGGEPTLRGDLSELIAAIKKRDMMVSLTTNGSLSLEKFEKIIKADLIRVSIDGTEAFHDSVRKTPGAFRNAINTLRFLKSKNVKSQITVVYTPSASYEMLEELSNISKGLKIQMAINVLGRNINNNNANEDTKSALDLDLPFLAKYINVVKKLRIKYGSVIANPEPLITILRQGGLDVFGCRAMDIAISVKHDGSVSLPCNGLSVRNIKGDLRAAYYGKETLELEALQGNHRACKGCYIKCMCSASALLKINGIAAIIDSYLKSIL